MKHKTWFRLVIRAIGVLILALSLPDVIHGVVYLLYRVTSAETFLGDTLISVISLTGPLIGCALGVYLFVLEANSSARHFYERLGARNAGATIMETHGGAMVRSCRYTWPRAELLSAA